TVEEAPKIALSAVNFGIFPSVNGRSRLETRFRGDLQKLAKLRAKAGEVLRAEDAMELGLVTVAPDDLDWEDELRLAIEERTSLSPDALTGMEAGPATSTLQASICVRQSAWIQKAGRRSITSECRITVGEFFSHSRKTIAGSDLVTTLASQCGSKCPANTALHYAA